MSRRNSIARAARIYEREQEIIRELGELAEALSQTADVAELPFALTPPPRRYTRRQLHGELKAEQPDLFTER